MNLPVKVYSYSKCSTCRKALKWLEVNSIEYEIFDIISTPPSKKNIVDAINQLEDIKYLFNTSGKSYRAIGSSAVKSMSEEQVLDALVSDGKLIKRPLLITGRGQILVGFKLVYWAEVLLN